MHDLLIDGNRVRFDVDTAQLDSVLGILTGGGVVSLTATPPTLEELFLRHYGERVPSPGDDETTTVPPRHGLTRSSRGAR